MITVKCNAEFSTDLVLAAPYAYWLYERGLLEKTIGVSDTKPIFYFSINHEESLNVRTLDNAMGLSGIPNNWIHHNPEVSNGRPGILDFSKWSFPPYKKYYQNSDFVFEKPLCIISNKYSFEWNQPPINFLDISTLYELFDFLTEKYTVIYKRPKNTDYISDYNEMQLYDDIKANVEGIGIINDYQLAKYMGVITFHELLQKYDTLSFNELQFKLYANCDKYVSVQGGNSHICAAFGDTNICYIKKRKGITSRIF